MDKLTKYEEALLFFYLPLFALKIMNVTADDLSLKLVGLLCFCGFALFSYCQIYPRKFYNLFIILILYASLLVFTSGKQAAFFSVVTLMLMYKVNMNRRMYRILFFWGIFFLLLVIGYESMHEVTTTQRYVNGEWVDIKKRNNILFVSFSAIVSLYLLMHRYKLKKRHIIYVFFASILMFGFVGSRTGLIVMLMLVGMLFLFEKKFFSKNIIIRMLCIYSPLYCMLFCVYSGLAYKNNAFLIILDMLLQGRIFQNHYFMTNYSALPFGQHIVEGADVGGEFLNLDCAYLDMLICEGIIFAVLWTIVSVKVIAYFYNRKRFVEVSILVMYALYGITETFLPNIFLNVSLFLYGEWILHELHCPTPITKQQIKQLIKVKIIMRLLKLRLEPNR